MRKVMLIILITGFAYLSAQNFEGFESGNFSTYEWQLSGSANWFVTNNNPYEGGYCAQSGDIDDSQTTSISISIDVSETGSISFYWKSDSEQNWDYLRFYIDNNQIAEISGNVSWTQVSANVFMGTHTFRWSYEKDGSVSSGADTGWIDAITFPPTITYDNDLAAISITGPGNVNSGDSQIYDVVVKNVGTLTQNSYTVKLMRQGNVELFSQEISESLAPDVERTHHLVWNIPAEEPQGATYVFGKVILNGDENSLNNETSHLNVQIFPAGIMQITVGTGSTLNNHTPVSFPYNNSLTETMYYPSELNAGGMITGISYENNFVDELHGKQIRIWIGETTLNGFADGWIPSTQLTPVFDGYLNFPAGQNTIMINLTEPYLYEGGNLVVMVQRPWDNTTYNSSDYFYATDTSPYPNRTIYNRDNNESYNPANPPEQFFARDFFPNTTFYFSLGELGNVQGYVYDENDNPISGALVERENSTGFTYTNEEGFFQFSNIPIGLQEFTASYFGYNSQTVQTEIIEDETVNIEFHLEPLGVVAVTGLVVGSNSPDIGLENATVSLHGITDYETETNQDGVFTFSEVYANQSYTINIVHDNYQNYSGEVTVLASNTDLGTFILNEITFPPGNVHVTQNGNQSIAILHWNSPGVTSAEFRYDDGNIDFQIGFSNTPANAVFGAVHHHHALIDKIKWWLSSEWGNHNQVKIFIFGLNNDGLPDSDQLLFQSPLISNNDDQWNSYELPEIIEAENGFLLGVNTPGVYTGIGLDDGVGAPWNFQPLTQMATENWYSGNWTDIGDVSPTYQRNMLIRAYGVDLGEVRHAQTVSQTNASEHLVIREIKDEKYVEKSEQTREFESFNIYRFPEYEHDFPQNWELLVEAITDTSYLDTTWGNLPLGAYQFAITSVYTNNVESDPAFSEVLIKNIVGSDNHNLSSSENILFDCYPNPFRKSTEIYFNIEKSFHTKLEIYNIKGEKVKSFAVQNENGKQHSVVWDGKDDKGKSVKSGIYFYKIDFKDFSKTKKMIFLK